MTHDVTQARRSKQWLSWARRVGLQGSRQLHYSHVEVVIVDSLLSIYLAKWPISRHDFRDVNGKFLVGKWLFIPVLVIKTECMGLFAKWPFSNVEPRHGELWRGWNGVAALGTTSGRRRIVWENFGKARRRGRLQVVLAKRGGGGDRSACVGRVEGGSTKGGEGVGWRAWSVGLFIALWGVNREGTNEA